MYNVGVIGAGGIAERHIQACLTSSNINIAAIADVRIERAKSLIDKYGLKAKVYENFERMITENKLDFAIINLPHFLHLKAAQVCAENGCSLLMEKPMALNTYECLKMIEVCNLHHVKLMIGHVIHYYPETMLAREIINSCELGKLLMINDFRSSAYFTEDRPQWFLDKKQAGGGILINLGAHSFDRILWTTGKKVKDLHAFINGLHPVYGVEGYGQVHLSLEGEIPAVITVYGYDDFYKNETEFYFSKGVLQAVYGEGVWITREGKRKKLDLHSFDPFKLQLDEFIGYLEGKTKNPIPGEYGMKIIELIQKAYEYCGV